MATLPDPTLSTTGSFADWMQNTAGLVISRAVDAEFLRKTQVNADPTTWPGYNDQGNAFARGAAAAGSGSTGGLKLSAPVLIGAGLLAVGLLVFLLKD